MRWEHDGTYRFDRTKARADVFSIDTPPPTVSGALHVGHVFSYTHTDLVARYQRMRGRAGLLSDGLRRQRAADRAPGPEPLRRHLRADAAARPGLRRRARHRGPPRPVSRQTFLELCEHLTLEDERAFEAMWRGSGSLSTGTHLHDDRPDRAAVSQRSFLDLLRAGLAYQAQAPTLWDPDFRTAVAQAELEDRPVRAPCTGCASPLPRSAHHDRGRHDAAGAAAGLRRARGPPRRRPLQTIDRGGAHAALPCRGSDPRPPPRRPRQGHRPRDGVHLRRHDRIVWWRELGLDARPVLAPDATIAAGRWGAGWASAQPARARAAHAELEGRGSTTPAGTSSAS